MSPSLSIVFPGSYKSPLILSPINRTYDSVLFVMISNKEYLAAISDGNIHLWDVAKNRSNVVYKLNDTRKMNLCVIDDRTVACGRASPSGDGISRIHILHTESKKWKLSGTVMVRVKNQIIDMCYVETIEGSPCLLICCERLIQSVQMIGAKIRWKVSQAQLGQSCYPSGICVDGSTIYVTDTLQNKLHLLSPEDGAVLRSIDLIPFSVYFPSCVRLHDDYLYIGHATKNQYAISKFSKQSVI